MSNIYKAFENKKAFIPFITCGDPDLETTKNIIRELEKNGADLIELGIPFSDPTAEGPVIQGANVRALSGGITTDDIFGMVREIRQEVSVPMVFMTYANVVFSYGMDKFFVRCSEIGMDGIILPDVPFEEKAEFEVSAREHGIDCISMVAPTSEEGFIYVVSSLGVTGERSSINSHVKELVEKVKRSAKVPCAVGFGISTPQQAAEMAQISDGAIIGSAIVRIIGQYGKDAPKHVGEFAKNIKSAYSKVINS